MPETLFMPVFFAKMTGLFRSVEVRSAEERAKYRMPLNILYARDDDGRPKLISVPMNASVFATLNLLEPDAGFKIDGTYGSGAYCLGGNFFRLLGVSSEYMEYPRNVFFCACILTAEYVEVADFCLDLLAQITVINYAGAPLPQELSRVAPQERDAFIYDRNDCSVVLNVGSRTVSTVKDARYLMENRDKVKISLKSLSLAASGETVE